MSLRTQMDTLFQSAAARIRAQALEIETLKVSHAESIHQMNMEHMIEVTRVVDARDNWTGQSIRLKWMIDEMERVGAIRLPDHDWVTDMAKYIEYPDTTFENGVEILGQSIFQNISRDVKRRYLPSYEDAHMEHIDWEEEAYRIREWSMEASVLTEGIPQRLLTIYDNNPGRVNKIVIIIQKHIRGHCARKNFKLLIGSLA
jgi:hypothetical protein